MTSGIPDKMKQSIDNVCNAIVNKINNLISTHNNDTNSHPDKAPKNHASSSTTYGKSSSQNYGHAKAGGSPQAIGTSLAAGTDNGIYARADHVHTVAYSNISGTPTIPKGSSTATDIQMDGTRAAGSSEDFARANHVHPTDTSRAPALHTHTQNEIADFSHTHGNIQNDGIIKVNGTVQASKNVCTDANGNIITENKNNHSHGSIASGGTLNSDITEVNKIAVTNSSNQLKTISNLPSNKVSEGTALENIGTAANASQHDINDAIDGKISDLQTNKSDATHNHDNTYINDDTGTVTSNNIADGTIVNGDIANTTITGGKLVNGTITATQLASNAVATAKIADKNVTTEKLADNAVTTEKIANGTIINEDISSNAAIAQSKISNLVNDLTSKNVTVTKLLTPTTGYIATYEVKQGGNSLGKIDIPKDYLVKSGTVKTVTTANNPVNGYIIGDKYIDFIINTVGNDGTDSHMYINVKDLIDTYTAGTGLNLSNNEFSVKYGTSSGTACQGNDSRLSDTRTPTNGTVTNAKVASNAAIDFSKLNISKEDIVGLGIPAQDTDTVYTHPSTHKTNIITEDSQLEYIGTNANDTQHTINTKINEKLENVLTYDVVEDTLDDDSSYPIQNGTVSKAIKTKANASALNSLSESVDSSLLNLSNQLTQAGNDINSINIELTDVLKKGDVKGDYTTDGNMPVKASVLKQDLDSKIPLSDGAEKVRDYNYANYTNINPAKDGDNNWATQKSINTAINTRLGEYIKNETGTVTSTNILNETIVNEDIAPNAAINFSKLDITRENIMGLGLNSYNIGFIDDDFNLFLGDTSLNGLDIATTKGIIQKNDTITLAGFANQGSKLYFYEVYTPSFTLTSDKSMRRNDYGNEENW